MPSMANITVKKADGTTDIIYTQMTPSSGDKTSAKWRCESIGVVSGNRPTLDVSSRSSVNGKFRLVDVVFTFPETYTDTTTGLVKVRDRDLFKGQFAVSTELVDTTTAEFAAQCANLLKSSLFQDVLKTGYAPT